MPLRFQRRIRVAPGISINLNKKALSISFGRRGSHITTGPKGTRTTFGLPGTGLYYTTFRPGNLTGIVVVAIIIIVLLTVLSRV